MKYLIIILLTLFTLNLIAQTPYYQTKIKGAEFSAQQVSLKNPWVGAKLSMPLQDVDGNLGKNTLFSARILYWLDSLGGSGRYGIPVASVVGLNSSDPLNPESGVNLGVYPYYLLKEGGTDVILHGGAGYKLLPTDTTSLNQFKFLAGLEFILGESLPASLGASVGYLSGKDSFSTAYGELTGILPLGGGTGLFAEYQHFFKKDISGALRVGLIVSDKL